MKQPAVYIMASSRNGTLYAAIAREKHIKAGLHRQKIALIEALNPTWRDLYEKVAVSLPPSRHCEERSDEAIQGQCPELWIASRARCALAMT